MIARKKKNDFLERKFTISFIFRVTVTFYENDIQTVKEKETEILYCIVPTTKAPHKFSHFHCELGFVINLEQLWRGQKPQFAKRGSFRNYENYIRSLIYF